MRMQRMAQGRRSSGVLTRLHVVAAVIALGLVTIDAVPARVGAGPVIRQVVDLRGTWRATLDPEDKGEREGCFKTDFTAEG
ncbi:MAG: hypothetical protein JW955_23035 [Sedimentisphaerales bacterium]|nr:hypothetical protein [Sedimentisphaerales bacterium]